MSSLKKLANQTFIYGGTTIIGRVLNYLLVPIYTYIFPLNEYGIVSILYAWVSLLNVLMSYGMETAFFRFNEQAEDNQKNKVYGTSLISIFITSVLFLFGMFYFQQNVANFVGYSQHPDYIVWFALIIAFDALCVIPFARLRAQNRPLKFAFIKILNIASNIVFVLFFLFACPWMLEKNILPDLINIIYDKNIGIGYIFISNLIASGITLIFLFSEIHIHRISFSWYLWKNMIYYAFPLLILGLAAIVNETMDRVLLKALLPLSPDSADSQIGIYGACYKISIMMTIFIQAFKYAAEPFFFSKYKDSDAKQTYSNVMTYFVIACSFIFLAIMLYMDIAQYFVGEKFREGIGIVPILLLGNLFLGVFYNLSIWYKLTGQTRFGAYITLIGAAITLALNYALIPVFGYVGSAWATFICYFIMMILSYLLGQKYYYVKYDLKRVLGFFILAVVLYVGSLFNPFTLLLPKLALNTVLMFVFIFVVFLSEKKKIVMVFNRK